MSRGHPTVAPGSDAGTDSDGRRIDVMQYDERVMTVFTTIITYLNRFSGF